MKKFFTLCFSLLMGCAALNAQVVGGNVDETFQFADAEGNIIPNGSRVVRNEIVDLGLGSQINSEVYVKNASGVAAFVHLTATVKSIENANGQVCWPNGCNAFDSAGDVIKTATKAGAASLFDDIMTEVFPLADVASCELELQLFKHENIGGNPSETSVPGSKITVFFTTDQTAGITDATVAESNEVVARYTLDGRAIDAPQKGVNIVKFADGRTVKVVVK